MFFFITFFITKTYEKPKSTKCALGKPKFTATNTIIFQEEFYECSEFTGPLSIPKSIQIIGNYAFYRCSGFDELTIPNSVISIGNYAFGECFGFKGTLLIPNSITKIGENAFYKCSGFTNLQFETTSLQSINKHAFAECTGLKGTLIIPEYLLRISDFAFYGCSGFDGLIISNFVTELGKNAFNGCSSMSGTLTIPKYIKSIGSDCFASTKFIKIQFKGQKEPNCTENIGFNNKIVEVKQKYQNKEFCQNQIKINISSEKVDDSICNKYSYNLLYTIILTLSLITIVELIITCKISSQSKSEKNSLLNEIENRKKENDSLKKNNAKLKEKIDKKDKKQELHATNNLVFFDVETIEKLNQIESLGFGAQSEVFKVSRIEFFALKKLRLSKSKTKEENDELFNKMKRFFAEYEFMNSLNHRNIIKTFGFCFGDDMHSPSILLEFCPYNLAELVKELTDIERITIIFEICLAMKKVHESNLIHRDLKPENILLDNEKHVKLSDFGISCLIDPETQSRSQTGGVGTLLFMAPELLRNCRKYSQKVDVYSFGVVLYFILTKGNYPKISIVDAGNGKKAKVPENVNVFAKQLIYSCWSTNEDDRPSFAQIIDLIKNNHFKLIDGVEDKISEISKILGI